MKSLLALLLLTAACSAPTSTPCSKQTDCANGDVCQYEGDASPTCAPMPAGCQDYSAAMGDPSPLQVDDPKGCYALDEKACNRTNNACEWVK